MIFKLNRTVLCTDTTNYVYNRKFIEVNMTIYTSGLISYEKIIKEDTYHILNEDIINKINQIIIIIWTRVHTEDFLKDIQIYLYSRYNLNLEYISSIEYNSMMLDIKENLKDMENILSELSNNSDILHNWCIHNLYTNEERVKFNII